MEKANFLPDYVEEINLLLLGETGVGKSTWINAFVNYLQYETLAEAEKNQLFTMIPSKFTAYDENFDEIDVLAGDEDKNESGKPGQSQTQKCRVYEFVIGKTSVRLIDTPGIGDTHGVEQDKLNLDNILKTIQNFKAIQGICILLKPLTARLTLTFRYCIKELLTHLHKSAVNNMVICFTNSKATNFKPGESVKTLKVQLTEDNLSHVISSKTVYFFDSEAFRYLAAIKNKTPIYYPDDEKAGFSESWDKSVNETKRLLSYLSCLDPHRVTDTVSLCDARRVIQNLTKPLANIFRLIDSKQKQIEEHKVKIWEAGSEISRLEALLWENKTKLIVTRLKEPSLVCKNPACAKIKQNNLGKNILILKKVCCSGCQWVPYFKIVCDVFGHRCVLDCRIMYNKYNEPYDPIHCRLCRHDRWDHMYVKETYDEISVRVRNPHIGNLINNQLPGKVLNEKMQEEKTKELKELEQEHATIHDAAVKFAYFLKTYAITPYNDAMEEYLGQLIEEERQKIGQGADRSTLSSIQNDLDDYKKHKEILEGQTTSLISPEDIKQIVETLQQLKHNGEDIKNALKTVTETSASIFSSSIVTFKNAKPN